MLGGFAQLCSAFCCEPFASISGSLEALVNVNHVLVTSYLDFWNAFYMELPLKGIQKLHLVQNAMVLVVRSGPTTAHFIPMFHEWHWLPVCFQIQFKVLFLTFKAFHGIGPGYLSD